MTRLTDERLAEIRARAEAVAEPESYVRGLVGCGCCSDYTEAERKFAENAPADVVALLTEIDRLKANNAQLAEMTDVVFELKRWEETDIQVTVEAHIA